MKRLRIFVVLVIVLLFGAVASAAPKQSAPGVVQKHFEGKMGTSFQIESLD